MLTWALGLEKYWVLQELVASLFSTKCFKGDTKIQLARRCNAGWAHHRFIFPASCCRYYGAGIANALLYKNKKNDEESFIGCFARPGVL